MRAPFLCLLAVVSLSASGAEARDSDMRGALQTFLHDVIGAVAPERADRLPRNFIARGGIPGTGDFNGCDAGVRPASSQSQGIDLLTRV